VSLGVDPAAIGEAAAVKAAMLSSLGRGRVHSRCVPRSLEGVRRYLCRVSA
jgi:hypothetical protein